MFSDTLLYGLLIVPVLAILIIAHELGHFFAARSCGVKVEEFGIGIPPRIVGWVKRDVLWSLNAIPFGGFVRVKGESGSAEDMDDDSMSAKPPHQRAFFLAAGAAVNLLMAFLLTVTMLGIVGFPHQSTYVTAVISGSPASSAGLLPGDRIAEIGDWRITDAFLIENALADSTTSTIPVRVVRNDSSIWLTLPAKLGSSNRSMANGLDQVSTVTTYERVPFRDLFPRGINQIEHQSIAMMSGMRQLFSSRENLGQVTGVFGMGQLTGELVQSSSLPWWIVVGNIAILLSLNLAFLNLLPLPAFDGGRLLFVLIEVVRGGRKVSPEREGLVHLGGIVVLIGLMLILGFADLQRIYEGRSILQ